MRVVGSAGRGVVNAAFDELVVYTGCTCSWPAAVAVTAGVVVALLLVMSGYYLCLLLQSFSGSSLLLLVLVFLVLVGC